MNSESIYSEKPITKDMLCSNCTKDKDRDLKLLADASRIVFSEPRLESSIYKVLKQLNQVTGLSRTMVSIFNRKTGKIYIKEACGVSSHEKGKGVYSLGEGITGRVVNTGESIIVPNIQKDERFLNRTGLELSDKEEAAFISVPIKSGIEVIGTLNAVQTNPEQKDLLHKQKILSILGTILYHAVQRSQAMEEEMQQLRFENSRLHERLGDNTPCPHLIGNSQLMLQLNEMIKKVATFDVTTLILGESGVGKELVAQAIHDNSLRHAKPFVKLNCAALTETIIESELFGHERGAFTGAANRRVGRFELARGGTIFLDEIGEISINIQAKLLRVLQEKEIERVGGNETLKVDVRIIAATNKNLEEKVRDGSFREDLYYRLNVIPLEVPPLRDRRSDITLLANYFLEKSGKENGKDVSRISTPAIEMLMAYHWPGNVRELENAMERAIILSEGDTIHGYSLPPTLQMPRRVGEGISAGGVVGDLQKKLDSIEYELIVEALKSTQGNVSKSAEMLGLSNRIIGLRMKKYDLEFKTFR